MTALNIYLKKLNTAATLGQAATFTGAASTTMVSTDEKLYYQAPISDWAPIFKFFTDGGADITDETVKLMTSQAYDIVGIGAATSSVGNTTGIYVASNTSTLTSNKINDWSFSGSSAQDPAAGLDFLQELSRAVFGSPEAIDMFSNESAVATSYGTAIATCATAISNNFATLGAATLHSAIGTTSDAKHIVAKTIYDQMRHTTINRFSLADVDTLTYGAGTLVDTTGMDAVQSSPAATTEATVDVFMNSGGTAVDSINVVSTGQGYTKGSTVTLTMAGGDATAIITIKLTSVQAAILNGKLDDATNGVEFPLKVGDKFHIKLAISNNTGQTNAGGVTLTTAGDTVTRTVDLEINLVA